MTDSIKNYSVLAETPGMNAAIRSITRTGTMVSTCMAVAWAFRD